jgi:long-chain acyl-CoA synthetase
VAGVDRIEDVVQREPGDLAVILYTSGTTGKPKGASLTHSNLLWNAHLSATTLTLFTPQDRILCPLPLFHTYAQTVVLNAAVHSGSQLVLMPRFDPQQALDLLHREHVTVFEGVPTMFIALVNHGAGDRDLSRLRMSVSAAASIPVETLLAFEREFGCPVLEGYGLSECAPVVSFNHPDRPRKPGSIGTPIWGVEMRLLDADGNQIPGTDEVGEIAVRGHNVMAGYLGLPEATAETISADGWLRTGDLARRDPDGYYYIVDRKKDMIIRGGYNVYPREIEEVLYEHPAVLEATVVGVPHPELGEEVAAAVVAKPGIDLDPDELRQFVRDRLAAYKYPRVVAIVDELPKGPTGKVLKKEIDRDRLLGSVALPG